MKNDPADKLIADSALEGRFKVISINLTSKNEIDYDTIFQKERYRIVDILKGQLEYLKSFKFYLSIKVGMQKLVNDITSENVNFRTSATIILQSSNIEEIVTNHFEVLNRKIDEYLRNGSGYVVNDIEAIHLNILKYNPLYAGQWLPLPKELRKKKCLLNIKNYDDKCFLWNCLATLHPYPYNDGNECNVTYYQQFVDEINTEMFTWPMSLTNIPRFEEINNFRINIIAWDKGDEFYPIYVSSNDNDDAVKVIMLLTTFGDVKHYVLVKDLNQLLQCKNKLYFCMRCFHGF